MRFQFPVDKTMSVSLKNGFQSLVNTLSSGVSYGQKTDNTDQGQNIDGEWVTLTTPGSPGTEFTVPLGSKFSVSGRIPVGFHVMNKDNTCDVYAGTTPWTSSNIYLISTTAAVNLKLFVF